LLTGLRLRTRRATKRTVNLWDQDNYKKLENKDRKLKKILTIKKYRPYIKWWFVGQYVVVQVDQVKSMAMHASRAVRTGEASFVCG
jgi:hypothetical protein